jgi:hypothetical protein
MVFDFDGGEGGEGGDCWELKKTRNISNFEVNNSYISSMKAQNSRNRVYVYKGNQFDFEAKIAEVIAKTGRDQIKKRFKSGHSVFFAKDGHIVEQHPDKSETLGRAINSNWVAVSKSKRKLILK